MKNYEEENIKKYFQILQLLKDEWYYLNPELVPYKEKLCYV